MSASAFDLDVELVPTTPTIETVSRNAVDLNDQQPKGSIISISATITGMCCC